MKAIFVLGIGAVGCAALASEPGMLRFVLFEPISKQIVSGDSKKTYTVGIDSKVDVRWQTDLFLSYIAAQTSLPQKTIRSQRSQLSALRTGVAVMLEGLDRRLNVDTAQLEVEAQPEGSRGIAQAALGKATALLKEFGFVALQQLRPVEEQDPSFARELKGGSLAARNGDFGALAMTIKDKAAIVGDELNNSIEAASHLQIYVYAHVVGRNGKATPMHLEGYDKIEAGEPKPFARNRLVLDKRALEDLQAAQEILTMITDLTSGKLLTSMKSSLDNVREQAASLLGSLKLDLLEAKLAEFKESLANMPDEEVGELIAMVRHVQYLLEPISQSPILKAKTEAQGLFALGNLINALSSNLVKNIAELPSKLGNIVTKAKALAVSQPQILKAGFIDFLLERQTEFSAKSKEVTNFAARLSRIAGIATMAKDLQANVKDLVPRDINMGDPLDTEFDLRTLKGERHPGDKVVVSFRVAEKGEEGKEPKVLEESRQSFRVEATGGYIESGAAVLLVDPRDAVPRDIDYQPTLGIGWHYKYGMKGNDWWNHTLNPGFGLSFSMLDFNDDDRFELGAAASLTLFNDALWVGYGRNIQANASYFYLGFNPTSLLRKLKF